MFNDLRFSLRTMVKRPASTLLAVLALALGIGLVTTQFSFVNGVMIKGLPFEDSGRIYHLSRSGPQVQRDVAVPMRDYLLWREQQKSFEDLAAFDVSIMNLSGDSLLPQRYVGASITSSLFPVLKVQPIHGRPLHPSDDLPGAPAVVLINEGIWEREFGRDPAVVGRSVLLSGEPATIIGVMPEFFKFPSEQMMWTNLRPEADSMAFGFVRTAQVVGRLKRDVSLDAARAEFDVIISRLAEQFPETNKSFTQSRILTYIDHFNNEEAQPILLTMFAMVLGVLLIACTNVANLLLARASQRGKELAIRSALGATRGRLFSQLICESTLLALAGAALGILIAVWGTHLIDQQLASTNAPFWFDVSIDGLVLFVLIGVTLLAGFVSGFLPALQATRGDVNSALKDEARSMSSVRLGRFSKFLVIVQVAVSCSVLVVTVLMAKTVVLAKSTKFAFDPDQMLGARIELMDRDFPEGHHRQAFYTQVLEKIRALPGVEGATFTSRHPIQPGVFTSTAIDGQIYNNDHEVPMAFLEVISGDYFKTLGIPLLQGRDFSSEDTADSPAVAIVNESFARKFWPSESPIGKRIRRVREGQAWATIIGVAPDLRMKGVLNVDGQEGYYLLQEQEGWGWMTVLVRTSANPNDLIQPIREVVTEVAPYQPVHTIEPVSATLDARLAVPRFVSNMFVVFGGAALFLGAVGLYGVMSFSVNQRAREFGIRFALGARVADVLRMVMKQGAIQLGIGLLAGLALAFGLSQPLAFLLRGGSPNDQGVYGTVVVLVALIALLAVWFPARRASRIDPMLALRDE